MSGEKPLLRCHDIPEMVKWRATKVDKPRRVGRPSRAFTGPVIDDPLVDAILLAYGDHTLTKADVAEVIAQLGLKNALKRVRRR